MNQEPINPDYGYILNQQDQTPQKKKSPKFILLTLTIVIGVICFGLLMFVRVQPAPAPAKVSDTTAQAFLSTLRNKALNDSYNLLDGTVKTALPESTYEAGMYTVLTTTINIDSCTEASVTEKEVKNRNARQVKLTCKNTVTEKDDTIVLFTADNKVLAIDIEEQT